MVERGLKSEDVFAQMLCSEPSDLAEEASLERGICTIEGMVVFAEYGKRRVRRDQDPCPD